MGNTVDGNPLTHGLAMPTINLTINATPTMFNDKMKRKREEVFFRHYFSVVFFFFSRRPFSSS
jgi:hypothetical protein